MFTGDAPYLTALRAALRPEVLARLLWQTLTATLAWLRGELEPAAWNIEFRPGSVMLYSDGGSVAADAVV
jgi:hypothetical protein